MLITNSTQDITILLGDKYKTIEKLLNSESSDVPFLLFMLALLGLSENKKIPLSNIEKSDTTHTFSIRTMYNRYGFDFDAYFGLIAILDNQELAYEEVVNKIAFERTGINNKKFSEMTNVKTFFEYLQGGIEVFMDYFLIYDNSNTGIVDAIHDYLLKDNNKIDHLIRELLLDENN